MNQCLAMRGMACVEALLYDREPMNRPETYKSMLCGTFLLGLAVMN